MRDLEDFWINQIKIKLTELKAGPREMIAEKFVQLPLDSEDKAELVTHLENIRQGFISAGIITDLTVEITKDSTRKADIRFLSINGKCW